MPDRRYAPRPAPGPIEQAVRRARSDVGRRKERLGAIADATVDLDEFTVDGVRFVVTEPPHVDKATGALRLSLLAAKDGKLLPGLDNPYLFDGPVPVEVPDGTWRKEKVRRPAPDSDGLVEVEEDVENMVENPVTAMQRNIATVVLNQARRAGWTG